MEFSIVSGDQDQDLDPDIKTSSTWKETLCRLPTSRDLVCRAGARPVLPPSPGSPAADAEIGRPPGFLSAETSPSRAPLTRRAGRGGRVARRGRKPLVLGLGLGLEVVGHPHDHICVLQVGWTSLLGFVKFGLISDRD